MGNPAVSSPARPFSLTDKLLLCFFQAINVWFSFLMIRISKQWRIDRDIATTCKDDDPNKHSF